MGLYRQSYKYMDRLLALEARSGGGQPVQPISGFLPQSAWEPFLHSHPDQRLAAFLRRGIRYGFRIGFDAAQPLRCHKGNLKSVDLNPQVVDQYIANEISQGKLRQLGATEAAKIHTSPIGIIPKSSQPGKFRLIVDLSSPQMASVNDGIAPSMCSLEYASLDQAVQMVASLGEGALMAKLDLHSAYRMVPVHPLDHWLLGLEWRGVTYCDLALPFGLRSAPIIFTAVADGLAWALSCRGIGNFLHYLDDFLFCGPPATQVCAKALEVAVPVCQELGLPVAPHKVEGPATSLTFLGIEIDSVAKEIRLPSAKVRRLREILSVWKGRRNATKHQLQSLIGQLNHAASVVRPGRTFLRHLIEAMKAPKRSWQRVRLNEQCRSDILWWATFLADWNGISFFPNSLRRGPSMVSDASGSWGCGAFRKDSLEWFQISWSPAWLQRHIAAKELFPIVVGSAIWGSHWADSQVTFMCDNQAVVRSLTSRSVRDPTLMHLLRCLFFFEAHFSFQYVAVHVPGKDNTAADALSRNQLPGFRALYPQAPKAPRAIPPALLEMLPDTNLTWTSPRWSTLLASVLQSATA